MKRLKYFEVILTMNAALLAGMIWVQLTDSPFPIEAPAIAQESKPLAFPNAAAQRQDIVNAIRTLSDDVRAMRSDLKSTEFKVRVTVMPDPSQAASANRSTQPSSHDPKSDQVVEVSRVADLKDGSK